MRDYGSLGYDQSLQSINHLQVGTENELFSERGLIDIVAIRNDAVYVQPQKFPGTAINGTTIGSTAWTIGTNIGTSDNNYGSIIMGTGALGTSNYLQASDFKFKIPQNAVINGVIAFVENKIDSPGTITEQSVRLVDNGTPIGESRNIGTIGTIEIFTAHGDIGDLWGYGLTPGIINNPNFGIAYSVRGTIGTAYVDSIYLNVYYTL